MQIPEPIVVNTGEQEKVQKTIDTFFLDTIKSTKDERKNKFLIESDELASNGVIGNNRVTYLLHEEQVIAVVLERRTEFNHVRYDFFRH
jgi:hypothetical protein